MNHLDALPKLGLASLALSAALLSGQRKCEASASPQQEQQQSQSQQQPPPPPPSPTPPANSQSAPDPAPPIGPLPVKRRKVWTNDDVVVLRTPVDNYLVEKEAEQAAKARVAEREAAIRADLASEKRPPRSIKPPARAQETEKMLKEAQDEVQAETNVLDQLKKEFLDAPAEERPEKQKEIDRLSVRLEESRRDVKTLQDHLQTLPKAPPEENPPVTPKAPPL